MVDATEASIADDLTAFIGRVTRQMGDRMPVPWSQFNVLSSVERHGALTTSQLAAIDGVRPQSTAYTVNLLVEQGWLERRPDTHDRRQTLLSLSATGHERMAQMRRASARWVGAAMDRKLSDDERGALTTAVPLLLRLTED